MEDKPLTLSEWFAVIGFGLCMIGYGVIALLFWAFVG
jgi:hypothetical protein